MKASVYLAGVALGAAILLQGCSSTEVLPARGDSEALKERILNVPSELVLPRGASTENGLLQLANVYARSGMHDEAVRLYVYLLKEDPQNAKVWNNLGLTYLRHGIAALGQAEKIQKAQDGKDGKNSGVDSELLERLREALGEKDKDLGVGDD